ncbi:NYN domain-containing protein [bacterium]|nr:MAG: NYN domain-containing protein [bacterium]
MNKVIFFIDGFNLYHALNYLQNDKAHDRLKKYKWLNLEKLCHYYLGNDALEDIFYFTTLATWNHKKADRHKTYIRALEYVGVKVIYGEFKRKSVFCLKCNRIFRTFEEKQTDVNIALKLFELAVQDRYDKAVIISGDTDLLPAIKAVHSIFPNKQIGVVIPIGKRSEDMKNYTDFHFKMKERHLAQSQFEDEISLPDGSKLEKPLKWK